ncbi:MAG: glucose-6-phosphate dehydrogenase [Actinobacteria bacterium]|nr:glucose-6-phosphate dehydrogenase [Actinomycetota bacterium]
MNGPLDPHLFVIVGATGDLTARKLLPALHELTRTSASPMVVLGAATSDVGGDEGFRRRAADALAAAGVDTAEAAAWAAERVHYQQVAGGDYGALAGRIEDLDRAHGLRGNRVLYLALPPPVFPDAITGLGEAGLAGGPGWARLVVEKPFGRDLDSACALNEVVHRWFSEPQVYRIDHYLGKATVQNLLVFRFANPVFEASWNRDRVARVEITVAESLGVGSRGRYYDGAGAVRDMIQSHLTQVLTLVAMEAPGSMDADAIRAEKAKVLRAIAPIRPEDVVLGRYTAGEAAGAALPGYLESPGVAPGSSTPTYAALRLGIDNWRWQGVPFYLRTGKAMAERTTQVTVRFRPPPVCLFHTHDCDCVQLSDVLTLHLQPDEGFDLDIDVKAPGEAGGLRRIPLRFAYGEEFGEIPDAYRTLLRDVVEGDQTLFVHDSEVEESWRVYAPVVDADLPVHDYPAGSWGPEAAAALVDGGRWAVGGR